MIQNTLNNNSLNHGRHNHGEEMVKLILKGVVPVCILVGGLILLIIKLPGWGIILGLPMVVIGTVFLIYTYDEVVSSKLEDVE